MLINWREVLSERKVLAWVCKGYINEESLWCSASMNVMFAYLAWKSRPLSLCQIEVTFKESRPFFTEFLLIVVLKKDKKYLTNLKKVLYYFIASMKGSFSKIGVSKEDQNNEQVGNSKVCFACNRRKYVLMCREERIYMSYIYWRFICHAPFLPSTSHARTLSLSLNARRYKGGGDTKFSYHCLVCVRFEH